MIRRFCLFFAVVLLCSAVAIPASALNSEAAEFLSKGKLLDRVYEKPDPISIDGAFSISATDDRSIAVSQGKEIEEVVSDTGDEFLIFVGEAIEGKAVSMTVDMRSDPIDVTDHDMDELALRFQFYVSAPEAIKVFGSIELTSAGKSDYNEINWSTDVAFQTVKPGWNSIYLPFSASGENRPPIDLSNINYFRTYFFLSEEVLVGIDSIEIVPISDDLFCEDFESAETSSKWESDHYAMTIENGALQLECYPFVFDLGGTVTTFSDQLQIVSYSSTALKVSLKADDPLALKSLSVKLMDENVKFARYKIDISKISSEDYHTFIIPIQDMTMDAGFNPEHAQAVWIDVNVYKETSLYIDRIQYETYTDASWKDWLYGYEVEPWAYSIAVIPDIQELSMTYPDKLTTVMEWIVDNAEKENILFTLDLGDLTWNGHQGAAADNANKEFTTARAAFDLLRDAGMEFSVSYGNHDYTPGSPRGTALYNQYFPYEIFASQDAFGGAQEEGVSDNIYYYVNTKAVNYLIVALEFNPDAETVAWANEVIADHPDRTVIVTVHDYLEGDGSRWDSGTRLWNDLIKKHENIAFVICGHDWSDDYSGDLVMRRDKGENGNLVYQVMVNAQDIDQSRKGVGTLLMLRFSEDGNLINFNYFSPVSGYAFREVNQFTLALDGHRTLTLNGVTAGQVFCGPPTLSVESEEDIQIIYNSQVIPVVDGQFILPVTNKQYNLTVNNAFGRLTYLPVTVNEGHEGGKATCDTLAVCEHCGERYGDYAHTYDERGTCTLCGHSIAASGDDGSAQPTQPPPASESPRDQGVILAVAVCAAVVAACAVVIVWMLKKKS